jgi:myo-inositol 2-dehydrogenase / D-chiro-inositol 1-dehydrogenase
MSKHCLTRRGFLVGAAKTAAVFTIVPRHVLGGPRYTPPSETLTRAVIGTGGMGMGHVVANEAGKPPVTLAVCDVDKNHLADALRKAGRGCEGYSDFRRVLER